MRIDDLVPEFREELERARRGTEWDQEAVISTVTKEYGFLGHFVSCRIEPDQRPDSDGRDLLVIEFTPPEDRDARAAHEQFQDAITLAGGGEIEAAGKLLSQIADQFPEIPESAVLSARRCLSSAMTMVQCKSCKRSCVLIRETVTPWY